MNVLIVFSHPSPTSYNAALKDAAVESLISRGASVKISDLYDMKFNPVASLTDVSVPKNKEDVPEDLILEREKVAWADYIIFQFPMWWTSMPAILKGWFDRVFAAGFAYGPGVYNHGNLTGKKGMLSFTTGGKDFSSYGLDRIKGSMDERIFNIQHEILYFSGLTVLEPFMVPSGASGEERKSYIEELKNRMERLEELPVISYRTIEDYKKVLV
ncbi:NAD(P)H-dependent oxidoreductase [Bacillus sp. 31A1R]|uniref:NAD(P)H-dependent oxidoreductase n=1 Tax=Robertmurraya mangrovi TaxID=3098077 RepID=A0ABU5ITG8_9BACI|nr:NAD(P)H-dependent oxidoreductase [Bacillus sp. 31A1R]MDZ5470450.1 NAD(P)H-dependent oxidoreductase [Bacillus sp. 31A1R]